MNRENNTTDFEHVDMEEARIHEEISRKILHALSGQDDIDKALYLLDEYHGDKVSVITSEIKLAAAKKLVAVLSREGFPYDDSVFRQAERIISTFSISSDVLESPEVQALAIKRVLQSLQYIGNDLPRNYGSFKVAERIISTFSISSDVLESPEVQALAMRWLIYAFGKSNFGIAERIISTFSISPDVLQSPEVQNAVVILVENKSFDHPSRITGSLFNLIWRIMAACTAGPLYEYIQEKLFPKFLSTYWEILHSDNEEVGWRNVSMFFEPILLRCLSQVNVSITLEQLRGVAKHDQGKYILSKLPLLSGELHLSLEQLCEIVETDRFGQNLLDKLPKLDAVAKDGISNIFAVEDQTTKTVDRRSVNYRTTVLDRLKSYKNNPSIQRALEEYNIDMEAWLYYDNVEYFTLGVVEERTTAERIMTPVLRLKVGMETYVAAMKEALEEYKTELINTKIPIDTAGMRTQVDTIQSTILSTNDPQKKEKLTLGLQRLQSKLEEQARNPKFVQVWDKVNSEFSKLVKLAESIIAHNNQLDILEKSKVQVVDETTLKEAQVHKAKTWSTQKQLKDELNAFQLRRKSLFNMLNQTLSLAIGAERASGVVQQIHAQVSEHTDHLDTDLNAIFSLLDTDTIVVGAEGNVAPDGEVEDDQPYRFNSVHAKNLEGRAMSIRVGGRSRQDLYLGNYTTCCIRIDSDVHGAESPIIDYLTDVGMQNIVIYDESSGNPIACAWCWIGKETKTGDPALVIDNVEGWQKYTVNFESQLNTKLFNYLRAYADIIGVKLLMQGPDNNDLNPIPKEKQEVSCVKLGGSNRPGGYYLEAEVEPTDEQVYNEGGGVDAREPFDQDEYIELNEGGGLDEFIELDDAEE